MTHNLFPFFESHAACVEDDVEDELEDRDRLPVITPYVLVDGVRAASRRCGRVCHPHGRGGRALL